ncbi:hypothetical protein VA596_49870 [Amycolatopsis sp., V23-08]|uniref:Holin n=1 Tax=Amycolatopsis heterodermiae TaxID=3110235 RepID=A0ABU5RPJ8_9PSEU|nr:hypothetical protein [Amycolatopsis sp., V23-08]MEA5367719.1 hypothetical protein [Amycolatopsis sp., V23-08]
MQKLAYLAARGRKALAGLAGAILGVGGVAAIAPGLSPQWQATITALATIAAVWSVPDNAPKQPKPAPTGAELVQAARDALED